LDNLIEKGFVYIHRNKFYWWCW